MRLLLYSFLATPKWRNGRRDGLKHRWGLPHVGSIPTFGTFGGILAGHFILLSVAGPATTHVESL